MRKKNCCIMGKTMETVLYRTRGPWFVGMMSMAVELMGLRKVLIAAGEVVFRVVIADGDTVLYDALAAPMRVWRLPTMSPRAMEVYFAEL